MTEHRRIEDQIRQGFAHLPTEPASLAEFERVRRRARQRPAKQAGAVTVATTAAVVAVVLLTTPFRGSEGGGPPQAATLDVRQAAVFMERVDSSTREQGTFRTGLEMTVRSDVPGDPPSQSLRLDGLVDLRADVAEATLSMELDLPGVNFAPCTFVMAGGATYYRVPDSLADRYAAPWLEGVGGVPSSSGRIGSLDPRDVLTLMRSAVSLERVGSDTVRGVETTHYRGAIDATRVAQSTDRVAPSFIDHVTGDIPLEVWVDDDGLPRKITETVTLTVPPSGATYTITYRAEFFDFGTPLAPSVPASADVGADTPADAFGVCLGVPPSESGP